NRSESGVVARVAGDVIGADGFLPNMGTEDFLSCLSRSALEAACKDTSVLPRQRVKDTRAALIEHFKEGSFVHALALFAPDPEYLAAWLKKNEAVEQSEDEEGPRDDLSDDLDAADIEPGEDQGVGEGTEDFLEAAE